MNLLGSQNGRKAVLHAEGAPQGRGSWLARVQSSSSTKSPTSSGAWRGLNTLLNQQVGDLERLCSQVSISPVGPSEWRSYDTSADNPSSPDALTANIGTAECRVFRYKFFDKFQNVAWGDTRHYLKLSEHEGYVAAIGRF